MNIRLWPSSFAFDLLFFLSLSSPFFEKLRAYKRIICVIDARIFSSSSLFSA
jgi:hypothetical protein